MERCNAVGVREAVHYDKTGRNVSYVVKLTEHIGGRMTVVLT